MLKVKDARRVFFRGKPDEKVALDGPSLTLAKSDFAIVIGSNGAGKSTLMNVISGALMLDSGRIEINGDDVTDMPVHRRAFHVARVFQDPMKGTAAGMTIAENMLLAEMRQAPARLSRGLTPARREKYRENLSYLGLGLEDRLDTPVSLLSGGQRQSLSLVMAVSGNPDILLLDEHTAALDPRTADLVLNATLRAVTALKLTTMMVTHNMQHAVDYGNRVVMLDAGKVLLELDGEAKARATVADLIGHFSVKSDRMLLGA
ncbi:MAG: ATP-binding cassette domain-containing protein [Rhizobiaceae bacterium]